MEARFNGKCICGGHVTKGDEIFFANKKIVKCAGCATFAPLMLKDENGLGWIWAYRLGRDVDALRKLYGKIRAAYLALPVSVDGWANRTERRSGDVLDSVHGTVGRRATTNEEFDKLVKESMSKEIQDWTGVESYDRLSVGQLYCLHAAWMYQGAAMHRTWIEPSPETLESGGFLGGEMINSDRDAKRAIDEMVASVLRKTA